VSDATELAGRFGGTHDPLGGTHDQPGGAPDRSRIVADTEHRPVIDDGPDRQRSEATGDDDVAVLARTVEALLFLSTDPVSPAELAEATQAGADAVLAALGVLAERYAPGRSGIRLRELGGGWTLASDPAAEEAARRLFSRARVAALSPAQAETLAIVAYLQPISRPEITRIRGVSADSAAATLLDRGLIEPAGHSQFGAVLYRSSTEFLKLFGLRTLAELPDVARWDPTPQEQAELRERLLRAGEARAGGGP
jgi:segregation and condensation protein B